MENPLLPVIIFFVAGAAMVALVLDLTRGETCYTRDGAVLDDGSYVQFDEPERICESRGGGSYAGRSLRSSSSSNSSGSWFRK